MSRMAQKENNEIPNCFFDKIPGAEDRQGDHFEDFANAVMKG